MNGKTAKLLSAYSEETGRTSRDIKDWWNALVDEDRARARKDMTEFVDAQRKNRKMNLEGGDPK